MAVIGNPFFLMGCLLGGLAFWMSALLMAMGHRRHGHTSTADALLIDSAVLAMLGVGITVITAGSVLELLRRG